MSEEVPYSQFHLTDVIERRLRKEQYVDRMAKLVYQWLTGHEPNPCDVPSDALEIMDVARCDVDGAKALLEHLAKKGVRLNEPVVTPQDEAEHDLQDAGILPANAF